MKNRELEKALADHKAWVADPKKGSRANLRGANLRGANLRGANLSGANLSGADLSGADGLIGLEFSHDWGLYLIRHPSGPHVKCGCRYFKSVAEAEKHWKLHPKIQRREVVLPALAALLEVARAQGWPMPKKTTKGSQGPW